MSELNVYQRINAVMRDCEYIQKKQAQQGKGVKYDEVIAMLREHLIKHGLVMVVRQTEMCLLDGVEGTKQKIYQGRYELDIINMDKPSEVVTHTTYAHGMDGGDKAPGKAQTYAVKILLVKGFALETGEDEESRAEKMEKLNTISLTEQDVLAALIDGCVQTWRAMAKAYNITSLDQISSSKFQEVQAKIKSFKAKLAEKENADNS